MSEEKLMAGITITGPHVEFINNSFNYILTEMSHLTPEKLQLLANFFQLQASKYGNSLMITRITAVGFLGLGVTLVATAFAIQHRDARAAFIFGGALCAIIGVVVGIAQFYFMSKQNTQLDWYNRCIDFIELREQIV